MNHIFTKLTNPRSRNENDRRRELILNVLLLASLILSFAGVVSVTFDRLTVGAGYRGAPVIIVYAVFSFFAILYLLSRIRFYRIAAIIFVASYFLIATYLIYSWGILLAQGMLLYALVVVIASLLISTRGGIIWFSLSLVTLLIITYLQSTGMVTPNLYWATESVGFDDSIVYIFTLLVITITSTLSNREVERSLERAHKSEAALKIERDLLEVKVEERTRDLKRAQQEEIVQLYRFAELGKLASSLIHDLVNPLTAVSLNLERLNKKDQSTILLRAVEGTKRMENFIAMARQQIKNQQSRTLFSISDEITQAIAELEQANRNRQVTVSFKPVPSMHIVGNPMKFHEVMVNLIGNAIDSYRGVALSDTQRQEVLITATESKRLTVIKIQDRGSGIPKAAQDKIFEPFFSTKTDSDGLGLGLSITRDIVEKDFHGTISVESQEHEGTTFTITLPTTNEQETAKLHSAPAPAHKR